MIRKISIEKAISEAIVILGVYLLALFRLSADIFAVSDAKAIKMTVFKLCLTPPMQCFIYKSLKKDSLYLYIDKKDDFSRVPEALFNSFGKIEFVMSLELTLERKLARENAANVIHQLKEKGFFVQLPPVQLDAPFSKQ